MTSPIYAQNILKELIQKVEAMTQQNAPAEQQ